MSLTTSGPGHADQKRVHTCLFNVFVDRSHVNAKCKQSQFSLNICLKFPVILSRVCTRLCVRACVRACVCVCARTDPGSRLQAFVDVDTSRSDQTLHSRPAEAAEVSGQ